MSRHLPLLLISLLTTACIPEATPGVQTNQSQGEDAGSNDDAAPPDRPNARACDNNEIFSGAEGTSDDPYLICYRDDLDLLIREPEYWSAHLALRNDIAADDLQGTIGDISNPFTGHFDGGNFTLSNLSFDDTLESSDNLGLFGILEGSVSNLRIDGATIAGATSVGALAGYIRANAMVIGVSVTGVELSATSAFGGLVGRSDNAQIRHSSASGTISGGREGDTESSAGGLVGRLMANGSIEDSHAHIQVHVSGNNVGGLVGHSSGSIKRSHATGSVTGQTTSSNVGGLIGNLADGSVTESFATGIVQGQGNVGGLIGRSNATVTNSYATGDVSGSEHTGGLVGVLNGGTLSFTFAYGAVSRSGGPITSSSTLGPLIGSTAQDTSGINSYWNETVNDSLLSDLEIDLNPGGPSPHGAGLTESEFLRDSSFPGWDDTIWNLAGNDQLHPKLLWFLR